LSILCPLLVITTLFTLLKLTYVRLIAILVHAVDNVCSLCVVHGLFGRWLENKNVDFSWLTLEYNIDVNCCVCAVGRVMECSCFSFVGLYNIGDCKCAY
jgi:hypothetical protein